MFVSGIGPITKVIIQTLWKRLFESDNTLYLPRVIKEGYPKWGLPSYDPVRPTVPSDPVPAGPPELADGACGTDDAPIVPIATDSPTLQLLNMLFTNLSVMSPKSLTFSDTDPVFTAVVTVGTADEPFTLTTDQTGMPNFVFHVDCCEPVRRKSRQCNDDIPRWSAETSGEFLATAHHAEISASVRVNTAGSGALTVTIVDIGVAVDPKNIEFQVDVEGLPKWALPIVENVIQRGIGNGAAIASLQAFLNSPDVRANLETLINNALKNLSEEVPVA